MTPPQPPSADEIAGARLLADAATRRAALGIASSGGLLVADLPKQLADDDRERADQIIAELKSLGLVSTELVVIRRRNSAQVARVPTQAAIEVMAKQVQPRERLLVSLSFNSNRHKVRTVRR